MRALGRSCNFLLGGPGVLLLGAVHPSFFFFFFSIIFLIVSLHGDVVHERNDDKS